MNEHQGITLLIMGSVVIAVGVLVLIKGRKTNSELTQMKAGASIAFGIIAILLAFFVAPNW